MDNRARTSQRMVALSETQKHPFLKRLFKGMKSDDVSMIVNFIRESEGLEVNEFEKKINRLFIDKGDLKPRKWKEISEVLSVVNTKAR